jgi:hypothetical protein
VFSEHSLKLATEYLDRTFGSNKQPTQVEMLGYVDYFDSLVMELDEANAALTQRPSVFVHRIEGQIEFRSSGVDRTVTEDDLQRGIEQYREYFREQLEKLNARKSEMS